MSVISKQKVIAVLLAISIFITGLYGSSIAVRAASSNPPIRLSCTSKTLEIGDQMYLSAYSSSDHDPVFKSSNSAVASVSRSGKITAKAAGTAVITASIDGSRATCTIKVKKTTVDISARGIHVQLKGAHRLRAAASNYGKITWYSKNPAIATVSSSGIVTGRRVGTATIVAYTKGAYATCKVTVDAPIMLLSKTRVTLSPGQSAKIVATTSSSMVPVFCSTNPSVATVDQNGKITARKTGTTTIKITVTGVQKQCTVTVK